MGRLNLTIPLVASIALGVSSCEYISSINNEANRVYHAARWEATVKSCAVGEAYQAPTEPPVPRVCSTTVDPAYQVVAAKYNAIRRAWANLVSQAEDNIVFSAEMLVVLEHKNTNSIEQLAPQITGYEDDTVKLETVWRGTLQGSDRARANLQAAWDEVWPGNDLQFDLHTLIARYRKETTGEISGASKEALEHYHQNEFSRLAGTYLAAENVNFEAQQQSPIPQGCYSLAAAHRALEAALLVRYSLDKAIELDLELISRLAKVDLSNQSLDDVKMKKGRYGEKRVSAAIARLKLLKYLDTLVTDSLGIIIRDVGLEWDIVWPGHKLETNIFEYAGVPKVD